MKKDNLVTCDFLTPRGKLQRTRQMRLIGGRPIPGTRVTLSRDALPFGRLQMFVRAVCLKTGTLLCEPV